MSFAYLGALLFSIVGLGLFDWRFKMAFFKDFRASLVAIVLGVVLFLGWDLLGIALGVFFRGENSLMTGVLLAPELPLEELFFLILLCYTSLMLFIALRRLLLRIGAAPTAKASTKASANA